MPGLYSTFATDPALEKDGVRVEYGTNSKGEPIWFMVARAGGANVRYNAVMESKTKPHRRMIANGLLDQEIGKRILRETYAECVVLGWGGIEDQNQEEMEFSKANVIKLFTDLPDLFTDLQGLASDGAMFRVSALEEEAKN